MSIVDEKLAKAFLEDPDNVDLSEAAEITDNAATALSKYQGDLCLNGLTDLSLPDLPPSNGVPWLAQR